MLNQTYLNYNIIFSQNILLNFLTCSIILLVALSCSTKVRHYLDGLIGYSKTIDYAALLIAGTVIFLQTVCITQVSSAILSRFGIVVWLVYVGAVIVLFLIVIALTASSPNFLIEDKINLKMPLESGISRVLPFFGVVWVYYSCNISYAIHTTRVSNNSVFGNKDQTVDVNMSKVEETNTFSLVSEGMIKSYGNYIMSLLIQATCMILISYSLVPFKKQDG